MMRAPSRNIFRARPSISETHNESTNIKLARTSSITSNDGGAPDLLSISQQQQQQVPSEDNGPAKNSISSAIEVEGQMPKKKSRTQFGKKIKKFLTSSRKGSGSDDEHQSQTSSDDQVTLNTTYEGVDDYRTSSAELDPSPFQVELPTKNEITVHSKICALMDGYAEIHRDFDFSILSGLSHSFLEQEHGKSTEEEPVIAGSCHRDLVQKLLACADDIIVEGFFREYEYTDEENDKESEKMEALILSSENLRQIIVCFRGSTVLNKSMLSGKEPTCILHKEQNAPIMATFRSAYFGTPIEEKVFNLLVNLTARKPFFDVVMTGHSFSASTATISGLRYAISNSQMRVSCHVFGSPRVGGEEWRRMIHSVPNLRVYRTENGADPLVSLPGGDEWTHCGHAIRITGEGAASEFEARRFDRRSSAASGNNGLLGFTKMGKGKADHKIQSYEKKLTSSDDKWFSDFHEMKGEGIQASNERRTLA